MAQSKFFDAQSSFHQLQNEITPSSSSTVVNCIPSESDEDVESINPPLPQAPHVTVETNITPDAAVLSCSKDTMAYGDCSLHIKSYGIEISLKKILKKTSTLKSQLSFRGILSIGSVCLFRTFARMSQQTCNLLFVQIQNQQGSPFGTFWRELFDFNAYHERLTPEERRFYLKGPFVVYYFDDDVEFAKCQSIIETHVDLKQTSLDFVPEQVKKFHQSRTRAFIKKKNELGPVQNPIDDFFAKTSSSLDIVVPPPTLKRKRQSQRIANKKKQTPQEPVQKEPEEDRVFVSYPLKMTTGQIVLTTGDLRRLDDREFFNDNLIDFYLRYLHRNLPETMRSSVHMFTTHFFSTLSRSQSYEDVRRWTDNQDIFDKDFLFIPINDSFHWSLLVVCNPGIQSSSSKSSAMVDLSLDDERENAMVDLSSDDPSDEFRPCVLFFDSLGCHESTKYATTLYGYLNCEWRTRRPGVIRRFDHATVPLVIPKIPVQKNSYDCGVYLMMYVRMVLQRCSKPTKQDIERRIPSLTTTMFTKGHIGEFRQFLRQLLYLLKTLADEQRDEQEIRLELHDFEC